MSFRTERIEYEKSAKQHFDYSVTKLQNRNLSYTLVKGKRGIKPRCCYLKVDTVLGVFLLLLGIDNCHGHHVYHLINTGTQLKDVYGFSHPQHDRPYGV